METDLLGPLYQRRTIDLGTDAEGPVVATLVSRRTDAPSRRAVLYLHGFIDYFFQAHLADFYVDRGWDFYALDLRKYGRSLRPHQTPNFCLDLRDYFPEIDAAIGIIRDIDGHDSVVINGHSTGGLIAALWAHQRRDDHLIDGMFLNSPFFDLNAPWAMRRVVAPVISSLGRVSPHTTLPMGLPTTYPMSLHSAYHGEWDFDLDWKPLNGFPVRAGWLRAIRAGHRALHTGLDIPVPILVGCSTTSYQRTDYHPDAQRADAVLNVAHIARWSPKLGNNVTLVRIDGALHDLTLSASPVRTRVFAELETWLREKVS